MSFQVSPGVITQEVDLSSVIPAVSTSTGAFAGTFPWGPVNEIVTVGSEKELENRYGTPTSTYARDFLTAASFLKYGNTLRVSRVLYSDAINATDAPDSPLTELKVDNLDDFESTGSFGSATFAAKYRGSYGNSIDVYVIKGATAFSAAQTAGDDSPADAVLETVAKSIAYSPVSTENAGSLQDEIHIAVVDRGGKFSNGEKNTILEIFDGLSLASDAKSSDGTSLYYRDVLKEGSSYIWGVDLSDTFSGADLTFADAELASPVGFGVVNTAAKFTLSNGSDGGTASPLTDNWSDAVNMFADAETVDVSLVFCGDTGETDLNPGESAIATLVEDRKDCVGFISAPISVKDVATASSKKTKVTTKFNAATRSSYLFFDSSPLYVYNKYQDNYVYIPQCGHNAGLCASTDNIADPWFSPAGFNRGRLRGVTKLAYNPSKSDRDDLYKIGVNFAVSFPGEGIVLYGDKTAQSKPSAFDRINVRRLFIVLEKAIARAAKYQLFELNDEFTRAMFRNMTEPFLRDVKGRRGMYDFRVICDETNNTAQVIDSNQFVGEIYIKPAKSINYIKLRFIATRTGVDFTEIAGASNA